MKLNKIAQILILSTSLIALASCSAHRKTDATGVNDANAAMSGDAGAQASGAGDGSQWGDNTSGRQGLHKNTYYFDFDRSDVREADRPAINANANYLIAHPGARVIVEGHTDPRGSREYNVALGERRANAVAEVLRSRGVGHNQIRLVSYGAERLASMGRGEADYQLDRRAVIVYTQK